MYFSEPERDRTVMLATANFLAIEVLQNSTDEEVINLQLDAIDKIISDVKKKRSLSEYNPESERSKKRQSQNSRTRLK